jgi:hypothetical protein
MPLPLPSLLALHLSLVVRIARVAPVVLVEAVFSMLP